MDHQSNIKNYEGVLAFKSMTNNLLAVVYTNGLFRIIDITTFAPILEVNVLADEGTLGLLSGRLIEGQIAFHAHNSVPNHTQTIFSKCFSFGIVVAVENQRGIKKRFVLHTFSLRFNDVPANTNEGTILRPDFDLDHTRQQVFEPDMVISSITACDDGSFLYTTFNSQSRETSIFSTSCAQPIWDRGSQEMRH